MALIYSILFKSEYCDFNSKIDDIYENMKNACFSREIWIIFILALAAIG